MYFQGSTSTLHVPEKQQVSHFNFCNRVFCNRAFGAWGSTPSTKSFIPSTMTCPHWCVKDLGVRVEVEAMEHDFRQGVRGYA